MALDRDELEREGHVHPGHWSSRSYYSEAGKEAAWRRYDEANDAVVRGNFPLLDLTGTFTRRDVLRAYRKRAHDLHPDHGGDAEAFRDLTAEKDRALNACRQAA